MRVRIRTVNGADTVSSKRIDRRNNRRGQTRAADLEPSGVTLISHGVVHGSASSGICVGRHIGNFSANAAGVFLPGRLRFISAAATSRAAQTVSLLRVLF